ncbi:hypothetical protein PPL_01951 [Heterostelium album PN500]|uniref:Uncharacterized protein n=1 Tax=Heterostelium pallidum (strain ATCC 26659 / Pp 5 / PN500) TaxID=670386 RepID=D3B0Y4_HETP5|nr:hypothetical protein PPL_01951 [Heterostelium album PN500]EFA84958.1 hypothetical protein PPL_01951 [Heterostelium album PN500]|eukprot:XP_020437068.1 hypothetical protein PPL_01951 [Heterostelium album PN500]
MTDMNNNVGSTTTTENNYNRPCLPATLAQLFQMTNYDDKSPDYAEIVAHVLNKPVYKESTYVSNNSDTNSNPTKKYNALVTVSDHTLSKQNLTHTLPYQAVDQFQQNTYYRFIIRITSKKTDNGATNYYWAIQHFRTVEPDYITYHILRTITAHQRLGNPELTAVMNKIGADNLNIVLATLINSDYVVKAQPGETDILYSIKLQ